MNTTTMAFLVILVALITFPTIYHIFWNLDKYEIYFKKFVRILKTKNPLRTYRLATYVSLTKDLTNEEKIEIRSGIRQGCSIKTFKKKIAAFHRVKENLEKMRFNELKNFTIRVVDDELSSVRRLTRKESINARKKFTSTPINPMIWINSFRLYIKQPMETKSKIDPEYLNRINNELSYENRKLANKHLVIEDINLEVTL
jgi:hypothetical protein